jgi:hypothetical protein
MTESARHDRLTAFEFIPATDRPQLVRLKRKEEVLLEFNVLLWLGASLPAVALPFVAREDLTIEGDGIGRPYWNDEQPPWMCGFDPAAERTRIEAIRRAAQQALARGSILLM